MNRAHDHAGGQAWPPLEPERDSWELNVARTLALALDLSMPEVAQILAAHHPLVSRLWRDAQLPHQAADIIRIQCNDAHRIVVSTLRPTEPAIAVRMVDLADIGPDHTVLEPSAGVGFLVGEIRRNNTIAQLTAVEIDRHLAAAVSRRHTGITTHCADFLTLTPDDLGVFDRIVMAPPRIAGQDVRHVLHALRFLTASGVLVGLVGATPHARAILQPIAQAEGGSWEEQPDRASAVVVIRRLTPASQQAA